MRQHTKRRSYDRFARDEGANRESEMTEIARYPKDHIAQVHEDTGEVVIMADPNAASLKDDPGNLNFKFDGRDKARDRRPPQSLKDLNKLNAQHYRTCDKRKDDEVMIHNHVRGR
jgi:hypothetical protein